jgi:hypothetical protein
MTPEPISKPVVLVVEGNEDKAFFTELVGNLGLDQVEIRASGGVSETPTLLKSLAADSGFENVSSIGIVRDADKDANAAFKSVCSALRNADLPVPRRSLQTTRTAPQVTVLILSGSGYPGMLEGVCLDAFTQNSAMECVEAYFECLGAKTITLPETMMLKAKLQVFLASKIDTRDKTGLWLGIAVKRSWWPWDDAAFDQVKAFLQQITP